MVSPERSLSLIGPRDIVGMSLHGSMQLAILGGVSSYSIDPLLSASMLGLLALPHIMDYNLTPFGFRKPHTIHDESHIKAAYGQIAPLDSQQQNGTILGNAVDEISRRTGINVFAKWMLPEDKSASAHAVAGAVNPAIVFSAGLLEKLAPHEQYAVAAHEVAHLHPLRLAYNGLTRNFIGRGTKWAARANLLFAALPASISMNKTSFITAAATWIVVEVGSKLVQESYARHNEYSMDSKSAAITGNPQAMAGAIPKLTSSAAGKWYDPQTTTSPLLALLKRAAKSLFHDHPSAENRIKRLHKMAGPQHGGNHGGNFVPGST